MNPQEYPSGAVPTAEAVYFPARAAAIFCSNVMLCPKSSVATVKPPELGVSYC